MARKVLTFSGAASNGAVSVLGLKVGDRVVAAMRDTVADPTNIGQPAAGDFAAFVIVDDELQQIAGTDLHMQTFAVLIERDAVF